jgi:hypothetical protein
MQGGVLQGFFPGGGGGSGIGGGTVGGDGVPVIVPAPILPSF